MELRDAFDYNMELVDRVAEELRIYRHSPMASCDLAVHILAIPEIRDALMLAGENPTKIYYRD